MSRDDDARTLDRLERDIGTAVDAMFAAERESSLLPEPDAEPFTPVLARRACLAALARADGKALRQLMDEHGFNAGERVRLEDPT
jgi:hypothetical protein